MPVFTAIGAAAATGLGFTAGTTGFAIASTLIGGITAGYAYRALAPDPPSFDASAFGAAEDPGVEQRLNARTTNHIPLLYGQWMERGALVYYEVSDDKQTLRAVVALGEGPATSIDRIYWDDIQLTLDADGVVTGGTDSAGNAVDRLNGLVTVQTYLGTATNNHSQFLTDRSNRWTNDHKMTSIVYAVIEVQYDRDNDVTSLADMRFVGTSPLVNPGRAVRDLLTNTRYGLGLQTADIDDASFNAAIAYYDGMVNHIDSTGATVSAPRFQVNGSLSTDASIRDRIDTILRGSNSHMTWTGGRFGLYVNRAQTPTNFTFTTSNVIGDIEVVESGFNNLVNRLVVTYGRDERNNYQRNQVVLESPAADRYPNEPDREIALDLPLVRTDIEAERLGTIVLNHSRQQLAVSHRATVAAFPLEAGDIVQYDMDNYGWNNKLFRILRVTEIEEDGKLEYEIEAVEYAASIYDDRMFTEGDAAPNTDLEGAEIITAVNDLSIQNVLPDRVVASFELEWTVPTGSLITDFDIFLINSITADFGDVGVELHQSIRPSGTNTYTAGDTITQEITGVPGGSYRIWVVGRNEFASSGPSNTAQLDNWRPSGTATVNVYRFHENPVTMDPGPPTGSDGTTGGWYDANDGITRDDDPHWQAVTQAEAAGAENREVNFTISGTSGTGTTTMNDTQQVIDFAFTGDPAVANLVTPAVREVTEFTFAGETADAGSPSAGVQAQWEFDFDAGSSSDTEHPLVAVDNDYVAADDHQFFMTWRIPDNWVPSSFGNLNILQIQTVSQAGNNNFVNYIFSPALPQTATRADWITALSNATAGGSGAIFNRVVDAYHVDGSDGTFVVQFEVDITQQTNNLWYVDTTVEPEFLTSGIVTNTDDFEVTMVDGSFFTRQPDSGQHQEFLIHASGSTVAYVDGGATDPFTYEHEGLPRDRLRLLDGTTFFSNQAPDDIGRYNIDTGTFDVNDFGGTANLVGGGTFGDLINPYVMTITSTTSTPLSDRLFYTYEITRFTSSNLTLRYVGSNSSFGGDIDADGDFRFSVYEATDLNRVRLEIPTLAYDETFIAPMNANSAFPNRTDEALARALERQLLRDTNITDEFSVVTHQLSADERGVDEDEWVLSLIDLLGQDHTVTTTTIGPTGQNNNLTVEALGVDETIITIQWDSVLATDTTVVNFGNSPSVSDLAAVLSDAVNSNAELTAQVTTDDITAFDTVDDVTTWTTDAPPDWGDVTVDEAAVTAYEDRHLIGFLTRASYEDVTGDFGPRGNDFVFEDPSSAWPTEGSTAYIMTSERGIRGVGSYYRITHGSNFIWVRIVSRDEIFLATSHTTSLSSHINVYEVLVDNPLTTGTATSGTSPADGDTVVVEAAEGDASVTVTSLDVGMLALPVVTVTSRGSSETFGVTVSTLREGAGQVLGGTATSYTITIGGETLFARTDLGNEQSANTVAGRIGSRIAVLNGWDATANGAVLTVTAPANRGADDLIINVISGVNSAGGTADNDLAVSRMVTTDGADAVFTGVPTVVTVRKDQDLLATLTSSTATLQTRAGMIAAIAAAYNNDPDGDYNAVVTGDTIRLTSTFTGGAPLANMNVVAGSGDFVSTRTIVDDGVDTIVSALATRITVTVGTDTVVDNESIPASVTGAQLALEIEDLLAAATNLRYSIVRNGSVLTATATFFGANPDIDITVSQAGNGDVMVAKAIQTIGNTGVVNLSGATWDYFPINQEVRVDDDTTMLMADNEIAVRRGLVKDALTIEADATTATQTSIVSTTQLNTGATNSTATGIVHVAFYLQTTTGTGSTYTAALQVREVGTTAWTTMNTDGIVNGPVSIAGEIFVNIPIPFAHNLDANTVYEFRVLMTDPATPQRGNAQWNGLLVEELRA